MLYSVRNKVKKKIDEVKDKALAICKAKSVYALEKCTPWSNIRGSNNLSSTRKSPRRQSQAPHSGAWQEEKKGPTQTETSEIQLGYKEKLLQKVRVAEVAQKHCAVPVFGVCQD